MEILPNYTYCTNYLFIYFLQPQKPFSDYQGIFFNRNIFAMHVQHKFISDLFLPYPQNMRCLMKFRRTFDLFLVLMLHYVFCFKIKILYHNEFSLYFFYRFFTKICILVKLITFYSIPLTTGRKVSLLFLLLFFQS